MWPWRRRFSARRSCAGERLGFGDGGCGVEMGLPGFKEGAGDLGGARPS